MTKPRVDQVDGNWNIGLGVALAELANKEYSHELANMVAIVKIGLFAVDFLLIQALEELALESLSLTEIGPLVYL